MFPEHTMGVVVPTPEPRSSVELRTSTRGTDITVKVYAMTADSSLSDIGDQALAEYGRLMREIDRQQMQGWADTVQSFTP